MHLASDQNETEPSIEAADVAVTLLSRDYKGLSELSKSNCVLEIFKIERE